MRVAVVGAGLGGLLAGAELRRRGTDVTVFEAAPKVGGVAKTIRSDGYLMEPGVGSFMLPDPALSPILDAAGVSVTPTEGRSRRLYSTGSGFVNVPRSPAAFLLSPIIGPVAKLRFGAETLVRSATFPGESVHGFLIRRFGKQAGAIAAHLAVSGVFAGDPNLIEAAAFPALSALENSHGSLLRGARRRQKSAPARTLQIPIGGMEGLAEQFSKYVGDVRTASRVDSLEPRGDVILVNGHVAVDAVVLAIPPSSVADLLRINIDPIPTSPVAVVFLGGPSASMRLPTDAFGLLVGSDSPGPVLGVLFERGPERSPADHQLAKVLVGGAKTPDLVGESDGVIVDRTVEAVGRIIGHDLAPTHTQVVRREIPQYVNGHAARIAELEQSVFSRVHLAGWWYHGIGISSLAADAKRIAAAIGLS